MFTFIISAVKTVVNAVVNAAVVTFDYFRDCVWATAVAAGDVIDAVTDGVAGSIPLALANLVSTAAVLPMLIVELPVLAVCALIGLDGTTAGFIRTAALVGSLFTPLSCIIAPCLIASLVAGLISGFLFLICNLPSIIAGVNVETLAAAHTNAI